MSSYGATGSSATGSDSRIRAGMTVFTSVKAMAPARKKPCHQKRISFRLLKDALSWLMS